MVLGFWSSLHHSFFSSDQGAEKSRFFKKSPTHSFLGVLGFIGVFYLNEQLESLLADLARQLSFYLDPRLVGH